MTLGRYPQTSLAGARTLALEAKGQLDQGMDPRDAKAAADAGAMTVATLAAFYFEKPHKRTGKPRKTAEEIKRRFDRNILPVIGSTKITEVQRRDVTSIVAPIMRRGAPTEAARTFEDVRALLRWALGQGYIDRNPTEVMEFCLSVKSAPRERVLTDAEIKPSGMGCRRRWQDRCCVSASSSCASSPANVLVRLPACKRTNSTSKRPSGSSLAAAPRTALNIGCRCRRSPSRSSRPRSPRRAGAQRPHLPAPEGGGSLPAAAVARTILRANETDKEHPIGRFGIAHFTAHDLRRTAVSKMAELAFRRSSWAISSTTARPHAPASHSLSIPITTTRPRNARP